MEGAGTFHFCDCNHTTFKMMRGKSLLNDYHSIKRVREDQIINTFYKIFFIFSAETFLPIRKVFQACMSGCDGPEYRHILLCYLLNTVKPRIYLPIRQVCVDENNFEVVN